MPAQGGAQTGAPPITLKSIANNADIDAIWETWQKTPERLRAQLNAGRGKTWEEWEIPRLTVWDKKAGESVTNPALKDWPEDHLETLRQWWEARRQRQRGTVHPALAGLPASHGASCPAGPRLSG